MVEWLNGRMNAGCGMGLMLRGVRRPGDAPVSATLPPSSDFGETSRWGRLSRHCGGFYDFCDNCDICDICDGFNSFTIFGKKFRGAAEAVFNQQIAQVMRGCPGGQDLLVPKKNQGKSRRIKVNFIFQVFQFFEGIRNSRTRRMRFGIQFRLLCVMDGHWQCCNLRV